MRGHGRERPRRNRIVIPDEHIAAFVRILELAGPRWTQYPDIRKHPLAQFDGRVPWDQRYAAAVAAASHGRIISCGKGYRIQELTPEITIRIAYDEMEEKALSTADRANSIMEYFNSRIVGKVTLPPDPPPKPKAARKRRPPAEAQPASNVADPAPAKPPTPEKRIQVDFLSPSTY